MISAASKLGGKMGYYQFMSSGAMNNMFLFQGLCIGVGSIIGLTTKQGQKRRALLVACVSLMVIGTIPFAAAAEKAELPESGDIYKFYRGAPTIEREVNNANTSIDNMSIGNCGLDTCLLSGKKEVIASMFPGSTMIFEFDYGDVITKEVIKVVVHDFNIKQNLVYDYSQYDYGIGIVEGDTIAGDEEEATANWWKMSQFSDNANNYINSPWKVSDKRKLPNNLRNYHFAANSAGKECGTTSNTGTIYSRQVILPKERGVSYFSTDSDVIHQGLFEIINGGVSTFKSLDEMKDGVVVGKGITLTLADHDKAEGKLIKGFCHHKLDSYGFENCIEYNYPGLGNPSSQGPGHFQVSKLLDKQNENPSTNFYFGRSDWARDMVFFKDSNCDSADTRSFIENTQRLLEEGEVQKVIGLSRIDISTEVKTTRATTWIDLKDKNTRMFFKGNIELSKEILLDRTDRNSNLHHIADLFRLDDEKMRAMMRGSSRSLIGWVILAVIAALLIAATVIGLLADINNNCCALERFGYNNFEELKKYGRPMNDSLAAYKPEVFWSGQKSPQGEPMSNSIVLRETQEIKARIVLEAEGAEVNINNDIVNIMKFEIESCDAVKSGSSGSCNILYEVIGSGGNVKLVCDNCRLNNPLVGLKSGQNLLKVGINSVGYEKSSVKICVSGSDMCSESSVNFITSPDGGDDMLSSGTNFGSPFMSFQDMMSNGWFAFTFVMVCLVSATLGILMLIALGYLIKDYVRPQYQGVDLKSMSVVIVSLILFVSVPCESLDMTGLGVGNLSSSDALLSLKDVDLLKLKMVVPEVSSNTTSQSKFCPLRQACSKDLCIVPALVGVVMLTAICCLLKDLLKSNSKGTDLKSMSIVMVSLLLFVSIPSEGIEIYGRANTTCNDLAEMGMPCSTYRWANNAPTRKYQRYYIVHANDPKFMDQRKCLNRYFSGTLYYNNAQDSESSINGTNINCGTNTTAPVIPYNRINGTMDFAVYKPTGSEVYGNVANIIQLGMAIMLPYSGMRADQDALFFTFYDTYFWERKTDKWFQILNSQHKEIGRLDPSKVTVCSETKWQRYSSYCPSSDPITPASENLCYGCYGRAICGFTKGDGIPQEMNLICTASPRVEMTYTNNTNASMSFGDIGVFGTGMAPFRVSNHTTWSESSQSSLCTTNIVTPTGEACDRAYLIRGSGGTFLTSGEVVGIHLVTDGINTFGARFEVIWSTGTTDMSMFSLGDVCPYLSVEEGATGPIDCIKSSTMFHCSIFCEYNQPARPSQSLGKAKLAMSRYGPSKIKELIKNSKGQEKKIIQELVTKNRKMARTSRAEPSLKDERGASLINYDNLFITNEGVALTIELGGPFELDCYFGSETRTFCNNSFGFGWVKGVETKPINKVDGNMVYLPEKSVFVHFILDGMRCEGVLSDVEGAIYCDNTCCVTSFDNFKTAQFAFAGDRMVPKSSLAQSYIDKGQSRSAEDKTVYPQGIDYNYNTTCKRDSSVDEMWICLREYYPQVFWPVIGTIIAFFVLLVVFLIWRFGLKQCGSMALRTVKAGGKKIVSAGVTSAKWIKNKVDRANLAIKLKFSYKLIEICSGMINEIDMSERDQTIVGNIKATLTKKIETWSAKMKGKKVMRGKNEQRVSLFNLESYRSQLMDICARCNDMERKTKIANLAKEMTRARETVDQLKKSKNGKKQSKD